MARFTGASVGERWSMRLRRAGLLMTVIAFARSERGRHMIDQARQKYDTPANRARVRSALHGRHDGNLGRRAG